MGSVTCTKVLPYMRLIPALLGIFNLPLLISHHGNGDGVGKGNRFYGTIGGGGAGYGPANWHTHGDGWPYGTGKGGGVGSGYGGMDGSNR